MRDRQRLSTHKRKLRAVLIEVRLIREEAPTDQQRRASCVLHRFADFCRSVPSHTQHRASLGKTQPVLVRFSRLTIVCTPPAWPFLNSTWHLPRLNGCSITFEHPHEACDFRQTSRGLHLAGTNQRVAIRQIPKLAKCNARRVPRLDAHHLLSDTCFRLKWSIHSCAC